MELWLEQLLTSLPSGFGYYLLITLIALCEGIVIVGLFIPGSVLCVTVGMLTVNGHGSIALVCAATVCGAIIGDIFSYVLGARSGSFLIHRYLPHRYRPLLRKAEIFFAAHGGKSLVFARFFGPLRGFIPFIAGGLHMAPRQFTSLTLCAGILWGICYPSLGYFGGITLQRVHLSSYHSVILLGAGLLFVLIWLLLRNRRRDQS